MSNQPHPISRGLMLEQDLEIISELITNESYPPYATLRKQLYLSLFGTIGGTYDAAARLCSYALDTTLQPTNERISIQDILIIKKIR
ncbi:MAG: hypothetical protein V1872_12200 [bacterium]